MIEKDMYYTFKSGVDWVLSSKGGRNMAVMHGLCAEAKWNTGCVYLTIGKRKKLITLMHTTPQVFSRCIREMLESHALLRLYEVDPDTDEKKELKGAYMINPSFFWKGTLAARKKLIKELTK